MLATALKPRINKDLKDRQRVLIVEDDRDLAELVLYNFSTACYDAAVVFDGRSALEAIARTRPDLVILDVMLPEMSGTEVARRVRTDPATSHIPIIMLTARAEEVDQIVGLAVGADDYMTKPFSMKLLLARAEAVLRRVDRPRSAASAHPRIGPIEVNTDSHEVAVEGRRVALTLTEFRILAALVQAAGRVLNRHQLMARAMGPGVTVTERTIDVHLTAIRKKLGAAGALIKTVRGVGYRVSAEADACDS